MLNKVKLILGALSFAGVAAKFGGLFGPVGAIVGSVLGTVLTFALQVVKWFFDGVTVIVAHPVTLVTVATCALLSFGSGVKFGKEWDAHLVAKKEATIQQMIADGKRADDANKVKLKEALAAKAKAEQEVVDSAGATPNKPINKRVRPKSAGKGSDQIGGPSLQWFAEIFGNTAGKN